MATQNNDRNADRQKIRTTKTAAQPALNHEEKDFTSFRELIVRLRTAIDDLRDTANDCMDNLRDRIDELDEIDQQIEENHVAESEIGESIVCVFDCLRTEAEETWDRAEEFLRNSYGIEIDLDGAEACLNEAEFSDIAEAEAAAEEEKGSDD